MKLVHDNDLANVSGGMSSEELDSVAEALASLVESKKEEKLLAHSVTGVSIGSLAGSIVGAYVGATQFRKYVLDNGVSSNSIVGAIINKTIGVGCSIVGGVAGLAVGAVTGSI